MFNDDWMRDRGFLDVSKPKAIDLIHGHKDKKLITVDVKTNVCDAVNLMTKFNISQIPVTDNGNFVGALNDAHLFAQLIADDKLKQEPVGKVMDKAFPFVDVNTPMEEVSKLITRENNAVLIKELSGSVHIITKHDIIEAISN
jgi:cystathionine beta-synthase